MGGGQRIDEPRGRLSSFWIHLADNLFRHSILFALPVAIFTYLGVDQVTTSVPLFKSGAVINAMGDPYAGVQLVRRADLQSRLTTAEGSARLIEEQLSTSQFATSVAERAGLGEAVGAGWGVLTVIRDRVDIEPIGASLIEVSAIWDDPGTSRALVEATIATYAAYIATTTSTEFAEAEAFYAAVLDSALDDLAAGEQDLDDFVSSVSSVASANGLDINQRTRLEILEGRVDRARASVDTARDRIGASGAARQLAQVDRSGTVTVIDAPTVPSGPISTTQRDVSTIASHLVMGLVVAFSALLVTTAADRALTVPSELTAVSAVGTVAVVPPMIEHHGSRLGRRRLNRTHVPRNEVT